MPDYVDVLPLLTAASASLPHNVLIQSAHVDPFELTSVIEIGESRMDCGALAIAQGDVADPGEPYYQIKEPMLPVEIVWIMDRVLEAEMAWHAGSALAQTLWTCVYMLDTDNLGEELQTSTSERPSELTTLVLRAHLRACLKTCDIVMEELLKRHVRDNEDFQGDKAGISMLEDVEIDTVLDELNEAYEWLMDWEGALADQWRMPLLTRIRLRMELLCAICLFAINDPAYEAIPSHLLGIQQAFDHIRRSPPSHAEDFTVPSAFNPEYARRLERSAPPRPLIEPLSTDKAWDLLQLLLNGIEEAVSLQRMQSWTAIEAHFLQMARKQPPTLPYVRSLHQTVFYSNKTVCTCLPLKYLGLSFLQEHTGCPTSAFENDTIASTRLPNFVENISGSLVEYIAALGNNRARSYRRLGKCLDSWQSASETASRLIAKHGADLQDIASQAGAVNFKPASIVSAMHRMQYTIIHEVQIAGFELDLYSQSEYPYVYWYMAHCARVVQPHTDMLLHPSTTTSTQDSTALAAQDEHSRSSTYGLLAETSLMMLFLSTAPPSLDNKLDKTRFKRRFAWVPNEGIYAARWEDYETYAKDLQQVPRVDLIRRAMDLLKTAQGIATTSLSGSEIRDSISIDISVFKDMDPDAQLQILPSTAGSSLLFPRFRISEP